MIFRQLTHDDLGCASYLIGDENAGVAAVVDPKLDIDEYLRLARYLGVRIEHVLETHNHADHVSGHGRLVAATGATVHIHRDADPDYDHEPFDDGWELAARRRDGPRAAHPRAPPRAHRVRAHRHRALGRAVGGPERRHAVRRRHRPPRPRRRQGGGRPRHLPLAQRQAHEPARHGRGVAGASRRLAVRRTRHGPEGLLDHRVRAGQPGAAAGHRRGRVRREDHLDARTRSRRTSRTSSRSTAARWSRRPSTRTRSARARSSRPSRTGRSSSTCAPSCSSTRRTSPAR